MGKIIGIHDMPEGKKKVSILVSMDEIIQLQGNLKEVHVFSTDACITKSSVIRSGINKSTKYFKIPKSFTLRNSKKKFKQLLLKKDLQIFCQRLETAEKNIFVYIIQDGRFS